MQITDLCYIDAAGYHFATFPEFLAYFQQKYRDIYGQDTYLEPDSQDGQKVASEAQAAYDNAAIGAATYNSFSPATAQGVGLSRVVKINGLTRRVPSNSTADLTLVGQAGTNIADGVAIDTLQQKWNLPASVLIPDSGTIIVTATADQTGAVAASAGAINSIFTPTLGWQTVTNVAAATLGAAVETDGELRGRQTISTANPSLTVFDGTIGGVGNLSGVTKVRGYENDTGSTDGNGIPGHNISLVVKGGDATQIAQEILLHKTPGVGTYGTTSETVYDAHGMPVAINFFRPTVATIWCRITISVNLAWSAAFAQLIKQAVADTINAGRIGDTVQITKLFVPAYLIGTPAEGSFDIATIELKKNAGSYGSVNIGLAFNEDAVCAVNTNVTIVIT